MFYMNSKQGVSKEIHHHFDRGRPSSSCLQAAVDFHKFGSSIREIILRCSLVKYFQEEPAHRFCDKTVVIHVLDLRVQMYLLLLSGDNRNVDSYMQVEF